MAAIARWVLKIVMRGENKEIGRRRSAPHQLMWDKRTTLASPATSGFDPARPSRAVHCYDTDEPSLGPEGIARLIVTDRIA